MPSPLERDLQQPESIVLLRQIADNTHTLSVKMFGTNDPNLENETGRLPLVEAKAEAAHRRIDQLQIRFAWIGGAGAAGLWLINFIFKK